jgi:hypothetical protein
MQKSAIAFQSYKKRLNKEYIKKGPAKLQDHCDSFVQYKQSQ